MHDDRIEGQALTDALRMMAAADGETFVSAAVVDVADDAFGSFVARNGYFCLPEDRSTA